MKKKRKKDGKNTVDRRGFTASVMAALGMAAASPAEKISAGPVSFHEADHYQSEEK